MARFSAKLGLSDCQMSWGEIFMSKSRKLNFYPTIFPNFNRSSLKAGFSLFNVEVLLVKREFQKNILSGFSLFKASCQMKILHSLDL